MYWLMLYAHPKPSSEDYGASDAGWASCFVNTDDASTAESRARELIDKCGWDSEEIEESKLVRREDFRDNASSLATYDQALLDGAVVTLHVWDVGAPDE
jgi:hypothetical protein